MRKAKIWIKGRSNQHIATTEGCVWFHFASLGEFEQGRPVLEKLRLQLSFNLKLWLLFFLLRDTKYGKTHHLADAVYYLPLDTAANASHFIDTIQPKTAIFTKYEYWYHYFNELTQAANTAVYYFGDFSGRSRYFLNGMAACTAKC